MRIFTPLIGQVCLGREQESIYRKKVLCSGLMHISVRETLLCNLTVLAFAHNCGNYLGNIPGKTVPYRVYPFVPFMLLLALKDFVNYSYSKTLRSPKLGLTCSLFLGVFPKYAN